MAVVVEERGSFGGRLRGLREAAGLSQEELAERAGLSSHAVSALERGTRTRPYPHTIRALADALGADGDARAALIAAVPSRRRSARKPADAAETARARDLPVPTTSLAGTRRGARPGRGAGGREPSGHPHRYRWGRARPGSPWRPRPPPGGGFADGVAYVELAPLLDPAQVLPAVADAVDAAPTPDPDPDRRPGRAAARQPDYCWSSTTSSTSSPWRRRSPPWSRQRPGSRCWPPAGRRCGCAARWRFAVEPLALPDVGSSGTRRRLGCCWTGRRSVSPGWGTGPEATGCGRRDLRPARRHSPRRSSWLRPGPGCSTRAPSSSGSTTRSGRGPAGPARAATHDAGDPRLEHGLLEPRRAGAAAAAVGLRRRLPARRPRARGRAGRAVGPGAHTARGAVGAVAGRHRPGRR